MGIRVDLSSKKIGNFKHFGAFPKIISNTLFFGKRVGHIASKPFCRRTVSLCNHCKQQKAGSKIATSHSKIRRNLNN
jgi:hypothetical protein